MKKLLLSVAFILVANLSIAQAQAFKDDVKKLVRITQETEFEMTVAKEQILPMIAADKQEAFLKEFEGIMSPMTAVAEKFYLNNYTHDEVKQMLKYYDSPVGKKIKANAAKLNMEKAVTLEEVGNKMNELVAKYMQ